MMKTKINFLSLAFLLISPLTPSWPPKVTVQLIRVIDGDTILVRSAGTSYSLRISLIDAPEMAQTCDGEKIGEKAKVELQSLLKESIIVEVLGQDMYGRTLVSLPQSLRLIESGWAFPYQMAKFSSLEQKRQYFSAFYRAFQERRGMWRCQKLMNPLFYRKKFKSKLK